MNSVTLIGNLCTEVEAKQVGEEKRMATFLLAVDRLGTDAGADFIRVTVWDRQAELCERFLAKGSHVALEGRLRSRSWEDRDGRRRSAVEVVASRVQFLSPREPAAVDPDLEAAVA